MPEGGSAWFLLWGASVCAWGPLLGAPAGCEEPKFIDVGLLEVNSGGSALRCRYLASKQFSLKWEMMKF